MPPVLPGSARGALRGVRAGVLALAALLLAATAHLAGGGTLPSLPALALLVVPLSWGAVALTGRVRGRVAVLGSLAVAQVGLHEAFMALSGPPCRVAAGMTGMHAMHGPPGAGAAQPCAGGVMAGMDGGVALAPAPMLAVHAAATIATALLLAHAERLLAALPALLLARVVRWAAVVVVPAVLRPVRRPVARAARPRDRVLVGPFARRGPPLRPGTAVPA